jgi:hypothetical protein
VKRGRRHVHIDLLRQSCSSVQNLQGIHKDRHYTMLLIHKSKRGEGRPAGAERATCDLGRQPVSSLPEPRCQQQTRSPETGTRVRAFSITSSLTDMSFTLAASALRTTKSATPSPIKSAAATAACCACSQIVNFCRWHVYNVTNNLSHGNCAHNCCYTARGMAPRTFLEHILKK